MPNASRYTMRTLETVQGFKVLIAYASSEVSGDPVHMRSLTRALAASIHK